MLTLLLGTDWIANRAEIMRLISEDVAMEKGGRILIVPELISHETERRLCAAAGDTTSRFAEVLSFTRLAHRVADEVGHGIGECLDNGGCLVTMAAAARQLHSKLKAYAAVETRPEFLSGLLDAVDEFKRCCISPEDLRSAAKQTEGSLAQKLEELSLILETYNALCVQGKRDPRDQITWLLEELADGTYAQERVFYIDGFPDFTRQHMEVIAHLLCHAQEVTISLNCDRVDSSLIAFEKAGNTAAEILQIAKKCGVPFEIRTVSSREGSLQTMRQKLFQGKTDACITDESVQVYRTETVYQECIAACERITKLILAGARYREIGIVCADFSTYRNTLEMLFQRCNIPAYISGTENILDKSVVKTVLTALDTALGGFDKQDVLRYLKSTLSPLDLSDCDMVENYAVLWGVNGNRWLNQWTNHPDGMGEKWTEATKEKLAKINEARRLAIEPLLHLRDAFHLADNLAGQVKALYAFFVEISLPERLNALAEKMDEKGDNRTAQILNQLWEILLTAMEQLHDMLGSTLWEPEAFTRLFKLLLSQYDVGTIPSMLDAVIAGPVSAMRCQKTKHLIVLGALEGNLPGYCGSTGVLNDQERKMLRKLGVPLTGGSIDGLQAEFAEIYGAFCGADESVSVSCPGGQPSFIYRRLSELTGGEVTPSHRFGAVLRNSWEAGAFFASQNAKNAADASDVLADYLSAEDHKSYELGKIARDHIDALYGKEFRLSASQIDRQAQCRFSYFIRYGLRAKERKEAKVDPAEFGTYVHAVLEKTAHDVMACGGFQNVSAEQTLEIAKKHSEQYAKERFTDIDTQRLSYLFHRNEQELEWIVWELWKELRASKFLPIGFEVAFGNDGDLPAVQIQGKDISANIRGFVDRIDAWKEEDETYFRVVDYKTGSKDFDYCDVINGVGLQMLLYMFALEQGQYAPLGDAPVSAGVQYFPARAPMVSVNKKLSAEEAQAEREKKLKRKGLLINDEKVLGAMSDEETENRMPYTRKSDVLSGDLADSKQFKMLKDYIFGLLGRMIDEIASGNIEPNPYSRGSSSNPCTYCPYGAICHLETVEGRRNFKAITANQFWEYVEKEVTAHG